MEALLWTMVVLCLLVGLAGAVLPVLPGAALVFAGVALGAWIDDFQRVSGWTVTVCGGLMLLAWAAEYGVALLGAQRVGASRAALVGAALGTVLGVLTGFVGLLVLPFVGAVLGEWLTRRDAVQATRVGLATWLGGLVGAVIKMVLCFMMVGLFVAALLVT